MGSSVGPVPIPGSIIPSTGPLGEAGDIIYDIGEIVTALTGPEDPVGWILSAIGQLLELLSDIIAPIVAAFEGRPKQEATLDIAKRLMRAKNPAASLYGVVLFRFVADFDVYLSSGSPDAEKILGQAFGQFVGSMELQGLTKAEAEKLGTEQLTRQAQDGEPLPSILRDAIDPAYHLYGDQQFGDTYQRYYQRLTNLNYQGDIAKRALHDTLKHINPRHILTIRTARPIQVPPPLPKPPPPPIQPPPNPLPLPQPQPQPQPQPNDQPWSQCCDEINQSLAMVAQAIVQGSSVADLVPQLQAIVSALNNFSAVSGGAGSPVSFTAPDPSPAIAQAAQTISSAIAAASNGQPIDLSSIAQPLMNLARCVCEGIEQSVKQMAAQGDIPVEILQQAAREGALSPSMAQVIGGSPWSWDIFGVVSSIGKYLGGELGAVDTGIGKMLQNLIEPWGKELWNVVTAAWDSFVAAFEANGQAHGGELLNVVNRIATGIESVAGVPALAAMRFVLEPARGLRNVKPGESASALEQSFARAWTMGELAHLLAMLSGILPNGLSRAFEGFAAQVSQASGWREITRTIFPVWYQTAFQVPARYEAMAQMRPILPDANRANEWHARRIIDRAALDKLFAFGGIAPDYEEHFVTGSYRPPRALTLLRGLGVLNVDTTPALDGLRFGGMRDADIDELIAAAVRQGIDGLIKPLIAQYITLAANGLLSDADLRAELQALNVTTEAIDLISTHARIQRTHTLATKFLAEMNEAAKGKVISLTEYQDSLAAVGYQQEEIDVFSGIIDVHQQAQVLAADARAQAAEIRQTQRLTTVALLDSYRKRQIDGTALTAGLIANGYTAPHAAAALGVAKVMNDPTVAVGSTLSPAAQAIANRKAAIKTAIEQFKKGLIPAPVFRDLLRAEGMAPAEIEATVSYLVALNQANPPHGSLTNK